MGIAIIIIGLATFFASTLSAPTATTIEPAACVYSVLPHYTAYAANLPNQKLTYDVIDSESCFDATYACSDGQSLEAYKLADSVLDPIPWFAGIKYAATEFQTCDPTAFADVVDFCMAGQGQGVAQCTEYQGEDDSAFGCAAKDYFEGLQ